MICVELCQWHGEFGNWTSGDRSDFGHTSGSKSGIVGVYQRHRYDFRKKRAALIRWANHVEALLEGKKAANVVEILRA